MRNNLIRIFIFLLTLWMVTSELHNMNWEYRSAFIASMVVCLLALWVGKRKFGLDKILYVKAYIFTGWLVVNLAITQIIGWNGSRAILNGSLSGMVYGLILLYSNNYWSHGKDAKPD